MVHRRCKKKKTDVIEDCRGGMTERGFTLLQMWRSPEQFCLSPSSEPASIEECAARLNCSRGTIYNALDRGAPPPKRGGGARTPPIATAHRKLMAGRRQAAKRLALTVTTVKRGKSEHAIRRLPCGSSRKIAAELAKEPSRFGNVSQSTVVRDLRAVGLVSRVRPVNPPVREGDEKKRLVFVRECLKRRAQLCKIHFSDEKYFNTDDHTDRTQYVDANGLPLPRHRMQSPPSVLVWAAIGVDFRQLIIYKTPKVAKGPVGRKPKDPKKLAVYLKKQAKSNASKAAAKASRRVGAAVYCRKILKPYLALLERRRKRNAKLGDVEFMQDGASAHTSNMAKGLLKENNVRVLSWPARSCDLNPVETLWAHLQELVSAESPTTEAELRKAIRKCFDEYPQSEINKLVLSFEGRCDAVVAAGGKHIKPGKCRRVVRVVARGAAKKGRGAKKGRRSP